MTAFAGRRYWLVGASEGLGLALAQQLRERGAKVVISARSAERLDALATLMPDIQVQPMDVGSDASVAAAAQAVGAVDGMVFLAGVYWPMAADQISADHLIQMCDVNFTGAARVVAAVLPGMVARGAGHLVLTGSLAGYRGLPGAVGYAASKAGVMALAESLYADLRGSGIKVQLANPGFIRTRLTDKNGFAMPFLMTPEAAASHMLRLMQGNRFSSAFPGLFASLFRLGQFLPDWAYYRLFAPKRARAKAVTASPDGR